MNFLQLALVAVSCAVLDASPEACVKTYANPEPVAVKAAVAPEFRGPAVDVVLTAEAVLVWDVASGEILYQRNAAERRPVASLSKLAAVLIVRDSLPLAQVVEIPSEATLVQRRGAHIRLPAGQHATVDELLGASLTASANDAMVSLAVAGSGSEEAFVNEVNRRLPGYGLYNTKLSNSTGLENLPAGPGGREQYSTAEDIRVLLSLLTQDPRLKMYLSAQGGTLTTQEGQRRTYKTTNQLLGTYVPVVAAKTGFTNEAGQNLALLATTAAGHEIGAVVLGSDARFQDMKILVEWIQRNYIWE